jgi:serine/threonine-protein kinase
VFIVHFAQGSGDWNELMICAGCGSRRDKGHGAGNAQFDMLNSISAESLWLCRDCRDLRLRHPKTHPDYLIEDWIGGGGMGDVYRARQLSKNRPVAIKMMSANSALGDKAIGYFQREIGVLRDLLMPGGQSHPSIVAFYELYDIDSQFQLIMEYVDGKNALDWLKTLDQPLPCSGAALIGRNLLSALDYAHSKGYVHRDVKPSNLLVMGSIRRPRVKLSDFGLAKSFAESDGLITLTRQGDIGGSIGFISPDHIRDFRDVREPADIYSAGATLYYLLTGHYPYLGFDPRKPEAYEIILEHPPVPLRAYRPDAPEALERVLLKALQKQPRDRWKSAHAMAEALRPFIEPATT